MLTLCELMPTQISISQLLNQSAVTKINRHLATRVFPALGASYVQWFVLFFTLASQYDCLLLFLRQSTKNRSIETLKNCNVL